MKQRQYLEFLLGALAITAAGIAPALAADNAWYAGVSLGQVRAESDLSTGQIDARFAAAGSTATTTMVDDVTGLKLFVGRELNKNFAVEAAYVDLGRFIEYSSTISAPALDSSKIKIKNAGVSLDAVATLPLTNQFGIIGKLGMYYSETKMDVTGAGSTSAGFANATERKWSPKFGLGARYNISDSIGLRVEWERYMSLGESSTTGEIDADLFTLGVVVKF